MRRDVSLLVVLGLIGALAAGCSSDKAPALAALKTADEAVRATRVDAGHYAPDQVKALEDARRSTKDRYGKGNYKLALEEAQALPAKAEDVLAAAAAEKAERTRAWEGASGGMPKVVDAIKSRVDSLSQMTKLPASITASKLAAAKAGLVELTQSWTAADRAFKAGNLSDAVATAPAMKPRAVEVLGMPVPDARKS